MTNIQANDKILINRNGNSYQFEALEMAELLDTDLLLVNRSGTSYKASGLDVKNSLKKPIIDGPSVISPADGAGLIESVIETDEITNVETLNGEWEFNDIDGTYDPQFYGERIAYGDGVWIAVGRDNASTRGGSGLRSTDGVNWTRFNMPAEDKSYGTSYYTVGYANGKWVATGMNVIAHSTDGFDWVEASSYRVRNALGQDSNYDYRWCYHCTGDIWVAVENSNSTNDGRGTCFISTDGGDTWEPSDVNAEVSSRFNKGFYASGTMHLVVHSLNSTSQYHCYYNSVGGKSNNWFKFTATTNEGSYHSIRSNLNGDVIWGQSYWGRPSYYNTKAKGASKLQGSDDRSISPEDFVWAFNRWISVTSCDGKGRGGQQGSGFTGNCSYVNDSRGVSFKNIAGQNSGDPDYGFRNRGWRGLCMGGDGRVYALGTQAGATANVRAVTIARSWGGRGAADNSTVRLTFASNKNFDKIQVGTKIRMTTQLDALYYVASVDSVNKTMIVYDGAGAFTVGGKVAGGNYSSPSATVGLQPTAVCTAPSIVDGVWGSTDWEVATNPTFTNIVASGYGVNNQTNWTVSPALQNGKQYWIHARHNADDGTNGSYGESNTFKTVEAIEPDVTAGKIYQCDGNGNIALSPANPSNGVSLVTTVTLPSQTNMGAVGTDGNVYVGSVSNHFTLFSGPWNGKAVDAVFSEGGDRWILTDERELYWWDNTNSQVTDITPEGTVVESIHLTGTEAVTAVTPGNKLYYFTSGSPIPMNVIDWGEDVNITLRIKHIVPLYTTQTYTVPYAELALLEDGSLWRYLTGIQTAGSNKSIPGFTSNLPDWRTPETVAAGGKVFKNLAPFGELAQGMSAVSTTGELWMVGSRNIMPPIDGNDGNDLNWRQMGVIDNANSCVFNIKNTLAFYYYGTDGALYTLPTDNLNSDTLDGVKSNTYAGKFVTPGTAINNMIATSESGQMLIIGNA